MEVGQVENKLTDFNSSKIKEKFGVFRKLSFSQKSSLFALLLLVLVLPIGLIYTLSPKSFSRSRAQVVTSPVEPPQLIYGQAVKFNNTGVRNENPNGATYVTISPTSILSSSPFTVELWAKHRKPPSGDYLRVYNLLTYLKPQSPYDYGYIYQLSFEVQETSGTARPMFSALIAGSTSNFNSNYISVGGGSSLGMLSDVWNHVAVTAYSEGTICYLDLFINGILAEHASKYCQSGQISTLQPQSLVLAKPHPSTGGIGGYYFDGEVDELRVSNTRRYTGNFTLSESPFGDDNNSLVLAHYDGDLSDASGNQNTGVSTGDIEFVPSTVMMTNKNPIIRTESLRNGKVKRFYKVVVNAQDEDGDSMQMEFLNLPPGLTKGPCQSNLNPRGRSSINCQILGTPINSGDYNVLINVSDDYYGTASKSIPLKILP